VGSVEDQMLINRILVVLCLLVISFSVWPQDELPGSSVATLVADFYKAFAEGDVDRLRQLSSNDIVWEAQSSLPVSGTFVGIDAVITNVFEKIKFYAPGFTIEPVETYQANNVVFVVISVGLEGVEDTRGMHVFFFEDRKIVRYMGFLDTLAITSAITRTPD